MTDYNDGLWHGWNGGECPVDPDAEIEIRWADPGESANNHSGLACKWDARCWNAPPLFGQIIAFRVTKPAPQKPRTIWMLETPSGGRNAYVTRAAADHDARVYGGAIITEWTEVLP